MVIPGVFDPRDLGMAITAAHSDLCDNGVLSLRVSQKLIRAACAALCCLVVHPSTSQPVSLSADQLGTLPDGTIILDRYGDTAIKVRGDEWAYGVWPLPLQRVAQQGPFRVLYQPAPERTDSAALAADPSGRLPDGE